MTQPAKVQEPSMEEILASIRRIIADDEAKPPAAEKHPDLPRSAKPEKPAAVAAPAKPPVMKTSAVGYSRGASGRRQGRAAARQAAPPPPPRLPRPAATNSQDDIDAMLAGLDEATSEAEIRPPQPEPEVFELTDEMAVPDPPTDAIPQGRAG